jgi:hypothetical protein
MTLNEAIKHCEDVARQKDMESEFHTDNERYTMTEDERTECKKCAVEHRQLADWLRELRALKADEKQAGITRKEIEVIAKCRNEYVGHINEEIAKLRGKIEGADFILQRFIERYKAGGEGE